VSHKALAMLLLVGLMAGAGVSTAQELQQSVFYYRSPVPMGVEGFQQTATKKLFYLMSSAENPEFQGLKITRKFPGGSVSTPEGRHLRTYPSVLTVRVTASMIDANLFAASEPTLVADDTDLNAMLLGLRYQLKVYQALKHHILKPVSVTQIGMPTDLPADERVFRVKFDTEDIPVDARLVLEVFSPKGEKLARFHLELL